jgi:hypothetical protein
MRDSSAKEPLDLRLLSMAEGLLFALHNSVASRELARREAWRLRRMGDPRR